MVDFKFADIGEGIHEGVILKWEYAVGDTIEEGETLVVIETDKVNAEIPAPTSGVIKELGPDVGETVHVGETLAKILEDGEEDTSKPSNESKKETKAEQKEEPKKEAVSEAEEETAGVVGEITVSNDVIAAYEEEIEEKIEQKRVLATPVARKLAKDLGVNIKTIKGSGLQGRIMKDDIRKAAQSNESKPEQTAAQSGASYQSVSAQLPKFDESRTRREKVSKLRETIARNMSLSKTVIPHTTVMDEVDVTKLVAFRNEQKALAEEKGVHLTYMPLIIKALTAAMHEYPVFNTSYDSETKELIYKDYINVGVAVDTPDGLIVPNIKNADKLSIFDLAKELSDLNDGTISVTNYGIFDSTFGAPVIKFPEVAIIGIGRISQRPVVVDGEIVVRDTLPLSLSIDHRVIDGGDAGRFLRTFKEYLTSPMLLLLS